MRRRGSVALLAAALSAGLMAAPAGAQAPPNDSAAARRTAREVGSDPALEAKVREVSAQLRCPVCQGLSLQDSPSELAQEMRDVVRDRLASGETPEQVKAYFVSKYGEWILLQPTASGFNLLVYVLPVLALLGGVALIVVMVRRWTSGAPAAEGALDAADETAEEGEWSSPQAHEKFARSSPP